MAMPLLQTKFYIPERAGRSNYVKRPHLLSRLNAGFAHKLILISAPAGFGKSTLLSEWIANSRQGDRDTGRGGDVVSPCPAFAWLSLDDGDNDPLRFWAYLVAALQSIDATLGVQVTALLEAPQPPPSDMLLTLLLNDLAGLPAPVFLVLDDYHVINTPAIHQALTFLLDHLPAQVHLCLATRADPPLPLARWRVRSQLTEIRADDLRFSAAEATAFLSDVMNLHLSAEHIAALEARTEGWIAGLQLAALSLRGVDDRSGFMAAFSGSHRYIVDYLMEEVLNQQTHEVYSFLLQTSILERLCGPLCDAVTGDGRAANSDLVAEQARSATRHAQAILEHLEHANLFLIPLDVERKWYRYHHLFGEVLANRLRQTQRATVPALHQRASAWYEQQALWSEAIQHALTAEDFARATRLIEQVGIAFFAQTNIQHSLNRWLSTLPEAIIRNQPRLCLIYAWILFAHLDIAAAFQWVAEAEAALLRNPPQLADVLIASEIAAMRALLLAYSPNLAPAEALVCGQQALATLNADQATFRCIAALGLGMAYMKQGDVLGSEQALIEATRMSQAAGNVYLFSVAASHQIAMQRARGAFHLALTTCQETLAWVAQRGALVYPTFGGLYLNLADLLREQNELDAAQRHAEEAVSHSDQEINPSLFIMSRLVLMRIKQAQGDWAKVWTLMREVSTLAAQHPGVIHSTLLPAITAQFQVAEGAAADNAGPALTVALAWAQTTAWEEGALLAAYRFFDFIFLYEYSRIARAQVLIAWARTTDDRALLHETLAYLERQRQIAEAGSLLWFQIKIDLLQALAHHALGDAEPAQAALVQALRLAQSEGYIRIFLDEGEPLRLLIDDFRLTIDDAALQPYVNRLVAAFKAEKPEQPEIRDHLLDEKIVNPKLVLSKANVSNIGNLVEPLSERELEVLRLVHAGFSNSEIADKIIVTVGTVKKHINNIFGKLGVESRTQALARAREHKLL